MSIKINLENKQTVENLLDEKQNRSSCRMSTYLDIVKDTDEIKMTLAKLMNKVDQNKLSFDIYAETGSMPANYFGIPKTTKVEVFFGSNGKIFVTGIDRVNMPQHSRRIVPIDLETKKDEVFNFVNKNAFSIS